MEIEKPEPEVVLEEQHVKIMKTISWNCWGLGSPRAVRALLRLILLENPHLVFLMETRLKEDVMLRIKVRHGFNSGLFVDCHGHGRERFSGLAPMWTDQVYITITSYSLKHIFGKAEDEESGSRGSFLAFMGSRRKRTLDLIKALAGQVFNKWICFGDINDTLSGEEKKGGNPRSFEDLNLGRSTIADCGLQDLRFIGYPFTWANRR